MRTVKHQLTVVEYRSTYQHTGLRDGFVVTPRRYARERLRAELKGIAQHLKKANEVALIAVGPNWREGFDHVEAA